MQPCSRLLVLACLAMLAFGGAVIAKDPLFDVTDVRKVRVAVVLGCQSDGEEVGEEYTQYLLRMGEKVFPAYEAILSDPKATPQEVGRVFYFLSDIEANRCGFLKHAVAHLTDADFGSRYNALCLLGEIGGAAEASPVVALLSDKRPEVVSRAAGTLADIGGPNEVAAMDVWLRGVSHRDNASIRHGVQYHRDKLKKRLDDAKDPRKRAQLRRRCWKELTGTEEKVVEVPHAVRELSAGGTETVDFLKNHLQPVPVATQKHLDQLLADLDCDSFDLREAAVRELSRGVVAESVLEKALAHSPSLELRRRLEAILKDLPEWTTKNPELLRSVRAIWVLQQIGTPDAQALLKELATGAPAARQTQKAKDALQLLDHLKKRQKGVEWRALQGREAGHSGIRTTHPAAARRSTGR